MKVAAIWLVGAGKIITTNSYTDVSKAIERATMLINSYHWVTVDVMSGVDKDSTREFTISVRNIACIEEVEA